MAIIKIRHVGAAIGVVAVLVILPLFTVWKQVYITETSLQSKVYADSLANLKQKVESLRIQCENLAQVERIEQFAEKSLNLHYPSSNQIVIIEPERKKRVVKSFMSGWEFFAILKKSLSRDKG